MTLRVTAFCAAILAVGACDTAQFGRGAGPGTTSDQRIASFQSELTRKPGSMKALTGIGDEYARQSAWAQASGAYREALIVSGTDRTALLGYSTSQSALGEYAIALDHANRAISARVDTEALVAAAVALNGQRRHAQARALLDQALDANPRDLDVRNNLALTLALMGDRTAYSVQRSVAYAPDADFRHHRNFYLIAAMLGMEGAAKRDGKSLSVLDKDIKAVTAIGHKARANGMAAFGLTSHR